MFNLTLKEKIRSALRRAYRPSSAARERCKTVFLSAVRTTFPATSGVTDMGVSKFRYFSRGFVTAIAIVALVGSVTTYADYADVSADNALYPLKRTSESVRLSLAGEEDRPGLHLDLANRRLKEMKTTKETARAEKLANDFTNEIKQSIVITVATPAAATLESPTMSAVPETAPRATVTVRFLGDNKKVEEGAENGEDRVEQDNGKKKSGRKFEIQRAQLTEREDDSFCDRLEEMVSDPSPAVRSITENDAVLHSLLSERCEFESSWGTELASTSLPLIP